MTRRVRPVGVVCAALVFVAASCTAEVGTTTGAAGTTNGGAGESATTVGNYGSSVTTAPPTTGRPLTSADLTELLPTRAEIGPGYAVVALDSASAAQSDREWDAATKKACPELYKVSSTFSQLFTVAYRASPAIAQRAFADADSRRVEVDLTEGADFIPTDSQLEKIISATNACDPIEVHDDETDGEITVTLRASPDNHYGDLGMVMTMDIELVNARLPGGVEMMGHVRTFQRGQTTVSITTVDGVDPHTGRALPVDYDLAADLAEKLDGEIQRLQGH
jgi:hypothetical protein